MLMMGGKLVLVGLIVGTAASFASSRLLRSLLFGVQPADPVAYAAVTLVLALIALVACYVPARRAARVDPMIALRQDRESAVTSIADSVLQAIGGTPVVRLRRVVDAGQADVLVKLESINPTGSYKDRMALAMIEGAEARGLLKPGMRVVEFTGGSTGSSLAMVCAAKGYPFVVLSSDAFAREKLLTMEALGAELRMIPSDGGKVTPNLFERFRKEIAVLAREPNTFWTISFTTTTRSAAIWASVESCCNKRVDGLTCSAARSAPEGCCAACPAR